MSLSKVEHSANQFDRFVSRVVLSNNGLCFVELLCVGIELYQQRFLYIIARRANALVLCKKVDSFAEGDLETHAREFA